MFLDNPSLQITISESDLAGIIKAIMKSRHWKKFQVASANLVLVPHWFFNFDVYYEAGGKVETYSSQMALNAVTGELNPIIVEIMKEIPVETTKNAPEGAKVEGVAISKEEAKNVSQIKIAGELGIPKDKITTYGFRLMYIPVYRTWISLGRRIIRLDIDAISGSPLNESSVPERERGLLEITAETIEQLKTPEGWVDYSKKAGKWITDVAKATGRGIGSQFGKGGLFHWLLTTKPGQYTLLILVIAILLYLVLQKYGLIR